MHGYNVVGCQHPLHLRNFFSRTSSAQHLDDVQNTHSAQHLAAEPSGFVVLRLQRLWRLSSHMRNLQTQSLVAAETVAGADGNQGSLQSRMKVTVPLGSYFYCPRTVPSASVVSPQYREGGGQQTSKCSHAQNNLIYGILACMDVFFTRHLAPGLHKHGQTLYADHAYNMQRSRYAYSCACADVNHTCMHAAAAATASSMCCWHSHAPMGIHRQSWLAASWLQKVLACIIAHRSAAGTAEVCVMYTGAAVMSDQAVRPPHACHAGGGHDSGSVKG